MTLYDLQGNSITKLTETSFVAEGIKERSDLQRVLRESVEVIAPGIMVLAEEFGDWDDSKRRIDLLGLDKAANLVVIELKRTEDGGHMELQSIRYAAMVSTMTFSKAVQAHQDFLDKNGKEKDAQTSILEFLGWDEPNEEEFAQDIRIILASAEFSREITTSVIWLNERGLDITCVRLKPYRLEEKILLDVQQIVPLPEAEDYQIKIREKAIEERKARRDGRDFTRFDLTIGDTEYISLPKRRLIFHVAKALTDQGVSPESIQEIARRNGIWISVAGDIDEEEFISKIAEMKTIRGADYDISRFFTGNDELMHTKDKTWALTKMWGRRTESIVKALLKEHPIPGLEFKESS